MNRICLTGNLLLLSLGITCCNIPNIQAPTGSAPKPVENTGEGKSGEVIINTNISSGILILRPILDHPKSVNQNIIAFNTGFMFTAPIENEPEVKVITETIAPRVFRFPGGTIANFYHPDGKGYGFREAETRGKLPEIVKAMPLFDKNAIYHFVTLCKMANSKVVYVANLLNGTVDEALWGIKYLRSQNIEVIGVELGNEFYFREYRADFPTVQSYITKAKAYAAAIRKYDPSLKIGAVAADATEPNPKNEFGIFMNEWNKVLGKETFYDFYIPHLYPKVQGCEQKGGNDLKAVFDCVDITLATEYYNYHKVITDYYKQFYGNRKMWVTEWNVDAASTTANTLRHAAFVGEFLMGLIDINKSTDNLVEYAFFHNYGSGGYAAPLFTYSNNKSAKYLKKSGNIAYNTTYFPFYYLTRLIYSGAERADEQITYPAKTDNRNIVLKTFISKDRKKMYIYYVNKSGQDYPIQLDMNGTASHLYGIKGNYPWSVAGLNGFYNSLPNMVDLVQLIDQKLNTGNVVIPKYSVGYVEYTL